MLLNLMHSVLAAGNDLDTWLEFLPIIIIIGLSALASITKAIARKNKQGDSKKDKPAEVETDLKRLVEIAKQRAAQARIRQSQPAQPAFRPKTHQPPPVPTVIGQGRSPSAPPPVPPRPKPPQYRPPTLRGPTRPLPGRPQTRAPKPPPEPQPAQPLGIDLIEAMPPPEDLLLVTEPLATTTPIEPLDLLESAVEAPSEKVKSLVADLRRPATLRSAVLHYEILAKPLSLRRRDESLF